MPWTEKKNPRPKTSKDEVKKNLINLCSYHLCVFALTFHTNRCCLSIWNLHPNTCIINISTCMSSSHSDSTYYKLHFFKSPQTQPWCFHTTHYLIQKSHLHLSLSIFLLNYMPWSLLSFTISTDSRSSQMHWFPFSLVSNKGMFSRLYLSLPH